MCLCFAVTQSNNIALKKNIYKNTPIQCSFTIKKKKESCSIATQKLPYAGPRLTSESHRLLMKLRIFFRGPRGIPNSFRSLSWQRALKGLDVNRETIKHCLRCCLMCACVSGNYQRFQVYIFCQQYFQILLQAQPCESLL